jgi:Rhamnan synthesis protein F/Methyltransferase domain
MSINSLLNIAAFSPKWLQTPKSSIGYLPFAAWVIREVSPKVFVELGTHSGNSYFTFCQSVVEAGLSTKCYAVDPLGGNEISRNPDEIFAAVNAHNEAFYAEFSQLLRIDFDGALTIFEDESIALLVIDGSQTYEELTHRFEKCLPKLTPDAIVLLSETKQDSFGARRLWQELKTRYTNNLEFVHASGLGVLQLNNAPDTELIEWLQPSSEEKHWLISYFAALDFRQYDLLELKAQIIERDNEIADLKAALMQRNLAGAISDQALAGRDAHIIALEKIIFKLRKEIKHIVYSKSWELTKPLRIVRRLLDTGQLDFSDGYTLSDFTDDPVLEVAQPNSVAAQLKPDPHYGFTYQEATRMAIVRSDVIGSPPKMIDNRVIAVVIHAFYEDVFDEILGYLKNIHSTELKLYVTTPIELYESTHRKLQQQQHSFYVLPVSNRGRDILPFIKIMPEVLKNGHDLFIKLHTKKSIHREDGDLWRKDIFEKLLCEPALKTNIDYLINNPEIGILGPTEHIVPMKLYMGSNTVRVTQLAGRMGVDGDTLENINFVAGSMFIARTKAIIPLMNITLTETDFEAEAKQNDGTLAHAIERLFSVSAFSLHLKISSPDNVITESYKYTNRH